MDLAWNMVSNRSSVFLCLINVCQHYRRTTLSLSSSHHLDSRQKADWVRVDDINNYKQWKTCFFINWIWPHSLRWGHGLSLFVCVHVHMFCSRLLGSSQTARHQCGLWIEGDFSLNWCQSRDSGFCCTPQDSSSAHQVCLNTHPLSFLSIRLCHVFSPFAEKIWIWTSLFVHRLQNTFFLLLEFTFKWLLQHIK